MSPQIYVDMSDLYRSQSAIDSLVLRLVVPMIKCYWFLAVASFSPDLGDDIVVL